MAGPRRQLTRSQRRWVQVGSTIGIVILLLLLWQAAIVVFDISPYLLPGPIPTIQGVGQLLATPSIWGDIGLTTIESLLGFAIAAVLGVLLGVLLGKFRTLEMVLNPFIVASQAVPKIALAPLFVVWLGFGINSKVFIAASLALFPIMINTILGIQSIDRGHVEVMSVFRASAWSRFWLLDVRSSLPSIMSGMEMGIVLALIGAVVGEFIGGSRGLGAQVIIASNSLQVSRMFGVLIILTALGFVFYLAMSTIKRALIPWHQSSGLVAMRET